MELVEHAGISFRQLDYWTRAGYLTAVRPARGSGSQRGYDETEIAVAEVLRVVVPLCGARLVDGDDVRRIGDHVRAGLRGRVHISPGLVLDLDLVCGKSRADRARAR